MSCSFPRPATPVETQAIADWYKRIYDCDDMLPDQIMVIPDYMTGCPGYAGQVWITVWDGAPEFVDVFTLEPDTKCNVCGHLEWRHDGSPRYVPEDLKILHRYEPKYIKLVDRLRRVMCGASSQTEEELNPRQTVASIVCDDDDQPCVGCGRMVSFQEYQDEEMDLCHACLSPICPDCDVEMQTNDIWTCPSCSQDTRDPDIIPGADDGRLTLEETK